MCAFGPISLFGFLERKGLEGSFFCWLLWNELILIVSVMLGTKCLGLKLFASDSDVNTMNHFRDVGKPEETL